MDDELKKESIKKIVWALRRIVTVIYHDSRQMIKQFGITGPQSTVIKCIYVSKKPLSSADLSRSLNVTPANITGIIDRLEERGLVKRTKNLGDRRITLIELTEKGREYAESLPDLIEEKLMQGLKSLSSTEVYGIYSAIDSIFKIIGEEGVKEISIDHDRSPGSFKDA